MPDIKKFIEEGNDDPRRQRELLLGLDPWNEDTARERAAAEGIKLGEEQLEVLRFMRDYTLEHGIVKNAWQWAEILDEEYRDKGGLRYLYRLFPHGPVHQGARLAALPEPEGTVDPSFGTAF